MVVICNSIEKCSDRDKKGCYHNEPHIKKVWSYQEDEPDCTYEGTCGSRIVKCIEYVEKIEINFGIEDMFEI